jgi:hypothetical protein
LLSVGIYGLRFRLLSWNSSIGCIYFWRTVLQSSASDRYLPMQSGHNGTRYLMFTLQIVHQIFSPADQI